MYRSYVFMTEIIFESSHIILDRVMDIFELYRMTLINIYSYFGSPKYFFFERLPTTKALLRHETIEKRNETTQENSIGTVNCKIVVFPQEMQNEALK